MCGIAGLWSYRTGRPVDPEVLDRMVASLLHRGPDETGIRIEGDLGIGARRLRVIDPGGGRQPVANEDGTVHVVLNGEIYNHRDLRRTLESAGHRFRTRCDTEVIAHAFEEWGPRCLDRLHGMFALAVWDGRRQRLLLARDRLGIKPLYVHQGPEGIAFGSELKAVLEAPWVPVRWDPEAVDDYLTYEYVPAPRTILCDVSKLPPGTRLLVSRSGEGSAGGRPQPEPYWSLEAGVPPGTPQEAAKGLRERLETAVEARLMADVPLGAFLSGGLDSSAVVALMSRRSSQPIRTFSLGFAEPSYDERRYSRLVAERFRTVHREEVVTPDIVDLAERLADHFDEPFADVSAFPTYWISTLARRDVTVALSGDGGDELLAGYDGYRADRWAKRLALVAGHAPWGLIGDLLHRIPPSDAKKGPLNRAQRFVEGLQRPHDLEHARWWVFQDLAERRRLYAPELENGLRDRNPFDHYRGRIREARSRGFEGLQALLYADVTGYLADDILVKLDRTSMAVSLEARVPFLEHELVEYLMSVPARWKLRRGRSKWILRRAFRDLLPGPILRRGKEGFSMPMKHWLRGPLRPLLSELLAPSRLRDRGWFRPEEVQRLWAEHLSGRRNHAHRLWCLAGLELSLSALEARARGRRSGGQRIRSGRRA